VTLGFGVGGALLERGARGGGRGRHWKVGANVRVKGRHRSIRHRA
jgi:hypothetical protein